MTIQPGAYPCPCSACVALGPSRPGISANLASDLTLLEYRIGKLIPGYELDVTSGYRCPAHNAAVGGEPDSRHLVGDAADILSNDSHTHYSIISAAMSLAIPFIEVCQHHVHLDLRPGAQRLILGPG